MGVLGVSSSSLLSFETSCSVSHSLTDAAVSALRAPAVHGWIRAESFAGFPPVEPTYSCQDMGKTFLILVSGGVIDASKFLSHTCTVILENVTFFFAVWSIYTPRDFLVKLKLVKRDNFTVAGSVFALVLYLWCLMFVCVTLSPKATAD